jgi:large subunit ribosomal protein L19
MRITLLLAPLSNKTAHAMNIIDKIQQEQLKKDVTKFHVGDSVRVHTRVVEGDKERIQVFSGIVIGRKGTLINETFTVRRISYGEGVERVFPIHSPRIAKIEVETPGTARRAKLNYLRNRKGKQAMAVREKGQAAA